jgi:lysozyme
MGDNGQMDVSPEGVQFIAQLAEGGFFAKPFDDGYGNFTIGFGRTLTKEGAAQLSNGITEDAARAMLKADLADATRAINRQLKQERVSVNQAQYDALVSLAYNRGPKSTRQVLRRLGQGDTSGAIAKWASFNTAQDKKTGRYVVSKGLTIRRTQELWKFFGGQLTGPPPPPQTGKGRGGASGGTGAGSPMHSSLGSGQGSGVTGSGTGIADVGPGYGDRSSQADGGPGGAGPGSNAGQNSEDSTWAQADALAGDAPQGSGGSDWDQADDLASQAPQNDSGDDGVSAEAMSDQIASFLAAQQDSTSGGNSSSGDQPSPDGDDATQPAEDDGPQDDDTGPSLDVSENDEASSGGPPAATGDDWDSAGGNVAAIAGSPGPTVASGAIPTNPGDPSWDSAGAGVSGSASGQLGPSVPMNFGDPGPDGGGGSSTSGRRYPGPPPMIAPITINMGDPGPDDNEGGSAPAGVPGGKLAPLPGPGPNSAQGAIRLTLEGSAAAQASGAVASATLGRAYASLQSNLTSVQRTLIPSATEIATIEIAPSSRYLPR